MNEYDEEANAVIDAPDPLAHFRQAHAASQAGEGGPRMSAPPPPKALKQFNQRVWHLQDWEAIQRMEALKWLHGKEHYDASVFEWNGVGRPIRTKPIIRTQMHGLRMPEDVATVP